MQHTDFTWFKKASRNKKVALEMVSLWCVSEPPPHHITHKMKNLLRSHSATEKEILASALQCIDRKLVVVKDLEFWQFCNRSIYQATRFQSIFLKEAKKTSTVTHIHPIQLEVIENVLTALGLTPPPPPQKKMLFLCWVGRYK